MEKIEQKILSIEDVRYEINYKTNGMNQEINRINKNLLMKFVNFIKNMIIG